VSNDSIQSEYHAAWVMESSDSVSCLALLDFRPEHCSSRVVRRASFGDIEALATQFIGDLQQNFKENCGHINSSPTSHSQDLLFLCKNQPIIGCQKLDAL
jgi:hypothetical protein